MAWYHVGGCDCPSGCCDCGTRYEHLYYCPAIDEFYIHESKHDLGEKTKLIAQDGKKHWAFKIDYWEI